MSMKCSRCGSEQGHMEYGSDGQAYCSNCSFYGLNRQCARCRMYLPWTELQTHIGQWFCQYCLMDIRDEEMRGKEHKEPKRAGQNESGVSPIYQEERCDRCGRSLTIVYYLRDRRLCETCMEKEKEEWEERGTMPPIMKFKVKEKPSKGGIFDSLGRLFEAIFGFIFGRKKKRIYSKLESAGKRKSEEFEKHFK